MVNTRTKFYKTGKGQEVGTNSEENKQKVELLSI